MQCHQSFFKPAYEFRSYDVSKNGIGDVTPVLYPDGSVKLHFIPVARQDRCYQYNLNDSPYIQDVINTDPWFVRNISCGIPLINNPIPSGYGNGLLAPQFTSSCCPNSPYTDYIQKFHNDNSTSTTDIYYFYPNLRQNNVIKYSAIAQTEIPFYNCSHGVIYNGTTCCRSPKETKMRASEGCLCNKKLDSNVSCMSIDEDKQKPQCILKNKKTSTKTKHDQKIICKCTKDTTDKYVTTFTDQACGLIEKDGRETQTKSKKCDIKTEVWTVKNKRRPKYMSTSCCECNSSLSGSCSSGDSSY